MPDEFRPRIVIVKLSAIGDVVHTLPVLHALRLQLPQAHISWVVEGRAGDLLQDHPALDRLIRLPRGWLKQPAAVWKLWQDLQTVQADVAIDVQCLARSAIVAWLSGAAQRIGFDGPDNREMSRWLHNRLVRPTTTHVIDRNLQLLLPLGIEDPPVRFDLPAFPSETAAMQRFLREMGLHLPFVVLNPGAGWPSKRWENDRFAAVARYIGGRFQMRSVVVWAGSEEHAWAEQIVAQADGHALLAWPTTLRELTALLRRARLFISADTGPLHIASAVGTPCIGLFGPVSARRNGPYGPQHIALQRVCLKGTSRQRRNASNDSLRAISVEDVVAACEQLLQRQQRRSA